MLDARCWMLDASLASQSPGEGFPQLLILNY